MRRRNALTVEYTLDLAPGLDRSEKSRILAQMFKEKMIPKDINGVDINPLDLVIIESIPDHYWDEPGSEYMKTYIKSYGLVTYFPGSGVEIKLRYNEFSQNPGWMSADGSHVFILSRNINYDEENIAPFDFWLPASSVRIIPYNFMIMNIFNEYPWQMTDQINHNTFHFINKSMSVYKIIKDIIETPYDELKKYDVV